ncbi:MAG: NAD-dependent epimerase/dehydratase family protein, partial [Gemmatimonadota bacterium]
CSAEDLRGALEGVDGVYHLAAYQDYMPDYSTFLRVNAVSTALLFELIVALRLPVSKVVLASSQSVYGEGKYRCPECGVVYPPFRSQEQLARGEWELRCPRTGHRLEPLLIDEARANPHTAYGISKYALELTSLNLGRKHGIPATCMRYSIVQGPRNSFYNAYSGIARIFALRLLHGQAPVCYEDGCQQRDYVYVGDVARANLVALEDARSDYQCLNVAGQKSTTVLEVAHLLARLCGAQVEPRVSGEYRFGDTRHTTSSWEAMGQLGWRPEVPLEGFLTAYVEWVRSQPGLADYYAATEKRMRAQGVLRRVAAASPPG